jgi:hypothetical protein
LNRSKIKSALKQAIGKLFKDPNIFDFTAATGQTEWNLAHHLARELSVFFPSLEYDLDLAKKNYGNKRPDIVFHRRGTHRSNYLVIELKRNGSPRAIRDDIGKIKKLWFKKPLSYTFGAVVNLRSDGKHEVQVFKNNAES